MQKGLALVALKCNIALMDEYHEIWCLKHNKTANWLQPLLAAGFDIYHLDENHANNDEDNLVLIYSGDHMRLHGMNGFTGRPKNWVSKEAKETRILDRGEIAYQERLEGKAWEEIEISAALNSAKYYAIQHGLEWPIKVPRVTKSKEAKNAIWARKMAKAVFKLPAVSYGSEHDDLPKTRSY